MAIRSPLQYRYCKAGFKS